jgi:hypothetical protein
MPLALCAAGQISNRPPGSVSPVRPGITAAPPAPPAGRAPMPRTGRGGGAIVPYGWGWGWGGSNVIVQEKEVEKEPSFRPWVENKEYMREQLNPVTRDYPDGALPAPKLDRTPKLVPCQLVLTSGEHVESQTCERRADLVSYIEATGRRIWLSTDLIDWTQSRFDKAP